MGPGAGDQLPLQAQQTSIGPSIGYAPSRLTPRIDHLPLRPSYSQAVSSSQGTNHANLELLGHMLTLLAVSFPPLTSVTKQYAQPVRGSPNMRASNKSNARGNRGPQRGGGVIQQGDRGSSRGSPSRNFPVPRGGSRPDGYGGRVGQINPEVSHQEQGTRVSLSNSLSFAFMSSPLSAMLSISCTFNLDHAGSPLCRTT